MSDIIRIDGPETARGKDDLKALVERDREIERLMAKIKVLTERLVIPGIHIQSLMDVEHAEIERLKLELFDKKLLITELADALEGDDWPEGLADLRKNKKLIRRARDATK